MNHLICPTFHRSSYALSAMQDLYGRGILHRDMNAANIMITVDGRGRLIDFDLTREVKYSGTHRTTLTVGSTFEKCG